MQIVSCHCAFDETIGIRLGRIHLGILPGILQSVVPAEVDLEVMLVGQRVVDCLEQGLGCQDLLAHLVHGVLHTRAFLERKESEGDLAGVGPRVIEFVHVLLDRVNAGEGRPRPVGVNRSAEDAVIGIL